ncbi:hypothetical protein OIU74_026204 [Salix koriyanagi]|uniref:Uncharacterized protein n=1 Tax=Salix koriyanagi TaxID=2511006 RepID=A0A9Q0VXQ1_9ROSI|nr:hypothetical protein OIU74_026204 [Salix koriyanagi]
MSSASSSLSELSLRNWVPGSKQSGQKKKKNSAQANLESYEKREKSRIPGKQQLVRKAREAEGDRDEVRIPNKGNGGVTAPKRKDKKKTGLSVAIGHERYGVRVWVV